MLLTLSPLLDTWSAARVHWYKPEEIHVHFMKCLKIQLLPKWMPSCKIGKSEISLPYVYDMYVRQILLKLSF